MRYKYRKEVQKVAKYPEMIELGNYVKELRGNDTTSKQLADAIGVSKSFISDIENGNKKKPRMEILERIANYFGGGDKEVVKYIYIQLLERAGYTTERNSLVRGIQKKENKQVVPLSEFIKGLEYEETRPLEANEFLCLFNDDSGNQISYRDSAKSKADFFDLNRIIQNEYRTNIKNKNNYSIIGTTPLYYCGKELTHEDRIKAMKLLDIVFDIDREEYNKNK